MTAQQLTFYFDVISPYAYLAFEQLPRALKGHAVEVVYRPVLFAGLLNHFGQKGPAEVEPKRVWTFRFVQWQAARAGLPLKMPQQHPFNPLAVLRLGVACGASLERAQVSELFRHVWASGEDVNDSHRLKALAERLAPRQSASSEQVKKALKSNTDHAIERGVFGVPMMELNGRLFWGVDSLPMVSAALAADPWFDESHWDDAARKIPHVSRIKTPAQ